MMPKEDRPVLDDLASFKIEKIYQFVREHQEQEEGLNALNTDYSAASKVLARKDAAGLEGAMPTMIDFQEPKAPQAGILPVMPPKPIAPKPDPIDELCKKFGGMTFTVEQFEYLSKSSLAMQRLLSDPMNWAEAYRRLVLRQSTSTVPLERNDGSFQSQFPTTKPPQEGAARMVSNTACKACGQEGHVIRSCPGLNVLIRNHWMHTRTETNSAGYNRAKYYFGPYPNEKWGVFPKGGFAPRPFGDDVLQWVLESLRDRYKLSNDKFQKHIKEVLPSWFGPDGSPIVPDTKVESGSSYSIEESEMGEALAQQTMALRSAAAFLENISQAGEVSNAEAVSYAVETRSRGVPNPSRVTKPTRNRSTMPRMKSSRIQEIAPSIEEDELLRYPPSVRNTDLPMPDAQRDSTREQVGTTPRTLRDSRSTTLASDSALQTQARPKRSSKAPTPDDLAALVRNTSPTMIVQALLNQEVRGIRQIDLLAAPEISSIISKALSDARQPQVRFAEPAQSSGETMQLEEESEFLDSEETSIREMFESEPEEASGETCTIELGDGGAEVIPRETLTRLCPKLSRSQQQRFKLASEVNETEDFQDYSLEEESQVGMPINLRGKAEEQRRSLSLKGQLPTCWVYVHGGMSKALIDTGSQLNVMRLSTARALNVYITEFDQSGLPRELQQGMITADGSMDPFVGTAFRVPIMIGDVLIPTHFRIVRKLRRAILLGTPWCSAAKLRVQFDRLGRTLCHISSQNNQHEVSFIGCDPASTTRTIGEGKE